MRHNQPVTQRERQFRTHTLRSTTDTARHIAYAYAAFLRTSGFEPDELTGQPHSLVRHPDRAVLAFSDRWHRLNRVDAVKVFSIWPTGNPSPDSAITATTTPQMRRGKKAKKS